MKKKWGGISLLSKNVNMTEGPILSSMIVYALPLVLSNLLNTLYNAADVMVVGNFAGKEAVAAVGATTIIIGLLIHVLPNIATGFNIILARAMGARDEERIKRAISAAYVFSIVLGITIAALGMVFARSLLEITNCPQNIIDNSVLYMQIYMLGVPATVFYSFMSCILGVSGDTKRPFYYLAISGLLNIVLNIVLVLTTGEPVISVAVATVSSMWLSAILLFIRLVRIDGPCHLSPFNFHVNLPILLKIIKLGIPASISVASFSLTNLQIQSAINSFGDIGTAGNTASITIENFLFSVTNTAGTVLSAFIGQNIGAGNREQTLRIRRTGYAVFMSAAAVMSTLFLIFGRSLLGLVIPGEYEAIDFGLVRLTCLASVSVIHAVIATNNGILQAFGYTNFQMIINLVGTCGLRFVWTMFIFPLSPTAFSLYICYPISYTFVMIMGLVMTVYLVRRYKQGKNFSL